MKFDGGAVSTYIVRAWNLPRKGGFSRKRTLKIAEIVFFSVGKKSTSMLVFDEN